jgi:hypothetical protein
MKTILILTTCIIAFGACKKKKTGTKVSTLNTEEQVIQGLWFIDSWMSIHPYLRQADTSWVLLESSASNPLVDTIICNFSDTLYNKGHKMYRMTKDLDFLQISEWGVADNFIRGLMLNEGIDSLSKMTNSEIVFYVAAKRRDAPMDKIILRRY